MTPQPTPQPRLFPTTGSQRRRPVSVINARGVGLSDLYHSLLRMRWRTLWVVFAACYLALNAGFGLAFFLLGGVANARPDSFADHFFFSVHTFGTIGYGSMYPQANAAEWLVTLEALVSLAVNAMATGLVFAKFARPTSRLLWSKVACVSDREGVPTLMFRVANERLNHVVEATARAVLVRAEVTSEGESIRRVLDLPLVRSTTPTFLLAWTVMHPVTKDSPLYGMTVERLAEARCEIVLTLTGIDETLSQTIYSRASFLPEDLRFGARFADILRAGELGPVIDYAPFHETKPSSLTWRAMGVDRLSEPR